MIRLRRPGEDDKKPKSQSTAKVGQPTPPSFDMFMDPPTVVHTVIKDLAEREGEKPVVIFDSHLGLDASCWSYVQGRLEGIVPTLAYDRLGYGFSSNPRTEAPRPPKTLAKDLRDFLFTVGLISESEALTPTPTKRPPTTLVPRPIILVAHSHASLTLLTFLQTYNPSNLLAIILLDPPPPSLPSKHPAIKTFLRTRLPRVLSTAAKLADAGILRVLSFFNIGIIASTSVPETGGSAKSRAVEGRMLRAMKREVEALVEGFTAVDEGLQALTNSKKSKPKAYIVAPTNPDPPMVPLPEIPLDEWSKWWHQEQRKLGESLNDGGKGKGKEKGGGSVPGWWIETDQATSTTMCASEIVVETIVKVVRAEGYQIREPEEILAFEGSVGTLPGVKSKHI
ncbi:hypothetical protein HK097_010054 [Rhizophlyctis rosea]|uniref:AB hydrolase-1 domain-containing protein n=1 Tax=Rhizophlyctis rosea TaxID=64517 RepID=A0AAD5SAC2_9FUNG|nr:hypothetical protein HK097_010054 [Rhizophlyctis rosea]